MSEQENIYPWAQAAMAELAGLLLAADSFTDLLQGVTKLAVRTIEPVVTCGITFADRGRVMTVASADELAVELDERQYERDSGPCLTAAATGEVVDAGDLSTEPRWGTYPRIARGRGIESVLSTPLAVGGETVGALNLYGGAPHAFGPHERQLTGLLAGQAAIAMTAALWHFDQVTLTDHLRTALSSRAVIDQAIGIIMEQRRCSGEEAFAVLRAASQERGVKLRVLAAELVTRTGQTAPP